MMKLLMHFYCFPNTNAAVSVHPDTDTSLVGNFFVPASMCSVMKADINIKLKTVFTRTACRLEAGCTFKVDYLLQVSKSTTLQQAFT